MTIIPVKSCKHPSDNALGKRVYEKVGFRSEHKMLEDEELFKIVLE